MRYLQRLACWWDKNFTCRVGPRYVVGDLYPDYMQPQQRRRWRDRTS